MRRNIRLLFHVSVGLKHEEPYWGGAAMRFIMSVEFGDRGCNIIYRSKGEQSRTARQAIRKTGILRDHWAATGEVYPRFSG
jgi:hypothetical protein